MTSVHERTRITLPKQVREEYGFSAGSPVMIVLGRGHVKLIPAVTVRRDQLWCFTRPVNDRIEAAEDDVAAGRSRHAGTLDEAFDAIRDLAPSGWPDSPEPPESSE